MKLSVLDLDITIRDKVKSLDLDYPYCFDEEPSMDSSKFGVGLLYQQDRAFFKFTKEILNSYRVGPSRVSPTRYVGDMYLSFLIKDGTTGYIKNAKLVEEVANEFAEKTINGIRFRTFTFTYTGKDNGFTAFEGVINFDFELYRGS